MVSCFPHGHAGGGAGDRGRHLLALGDRSVGGSGAAGAPGPGGLGAGARVREGTGVPETALRLRLHPALLRGLRRTSTASTATWIRPPSWPSSTGSNTAPNCATSWPPATTTTTAAPAPGTARSAPVPGGRDRSGDAGLRRSTRTTSRRVPWWRPMRPRVPTTRVPTTRKPARRCRARPVVFSGKTPDCTVQMPAASVEASASVGSARPTPRLRASGGGDVDGVFDDAGVPGPGRPGGGRPAGLRRTPAGRWSRRWRCFVDARLVDRPHENEMVSEGF